MNCGVACFRSPKSLGARPTIARRASIAVQGPTHSRFRNAFIAHASDKEEQDPYEYGDEEEEEEGVEGSEFIEDDLMHYDDPSMCLYLDSADQKQWETWAETGLFYGFTTNPTILKRDNVRCTLQSMRTLARHAFDLEIEELHFQAWGSTWNDLYSCGLDLYELDSRIVVKVPMTLAGVKAAHRLMLDDVPVTLTGVYSTHQAATAMAMGAQYIAPYLGRMNDAGKDGMEEIIKMQGIVDMSCSYEGDTRLLVASIRSADEIATLAASGCNTFTISPAIAQQLVSDPLTMQAAEVFEEHAAEMGAMRDQ